MPKLIWKEDVSKWLPRKQGVAIERMTNMPIREIIYATYRDTCFALELLQDDRDFVDVIKKVRSWALGSYITSRKDY
ncbi:hypothetical protein Ahy_A02g008266 [Arachis hypogaea]|uniref:Uncharacterized protein n=1 Tax=Arachis hypogaea TaxID=3818 RepID=A0A445EE15_ARAHY|nr:hypothetical protein Ahy_A02g008266 [Arachis hypogaea]